MALVFSPKLYFIRSSNFLGSNRHRHKNVLKEKKEKKRAQNRISSKRRRKYLYVEKRPKHILSLLLLPPFRLYYNGRKIIYTTFKMLHLTASSPQLWPALAQHYSEGEKKETLQDKNKQTYKRTHKTKRRRCQSVQRKTKKIPFLLFNLFWMFYA